MAETAFVKHFSHFPATAVSQVESPPGSYPAVPTGLSTAAAALPPAMVWGRIESYIVYRWTTRAVVWVVEGEGDWRPNLTPTIVSLVERWSNNVWITETTLLPSTLGGYELLDDIYRFTGTVGSAIALTSGLVVTSASAGGTLTRSAGSFLTDGFAVGQQVQVTGTTGGADDKVYTITAVTALVMTFGAGFLTVNGSETVTITTLFPPLAVLEAYRRLAEYMASDPDIAGASAFRMNFGNTALETDYQRNPAWLGKAGINSGAFDLLRDYRRVP